MRLTQALRAQHLGHMFKKHWLVQGRRTPKDSGARAVLEARNIEVVDALEVAQPKRETKTPFRVEHLIPRPQPLDDTHPHWNAQRSYAVDDRHVLLEGMRQAQVLTRTVAVAGLPAELAQLVAAAQIPEQSDRAVRAATLTAHVYDAEQVKLARRTDPARPAFVFARDYGIGNERRMSLLLAKLLAECELLVGRSTTSARQIVHNVPFRVPLRRNGDTIRFEVHADTLIASKRPIQATMATDSEAHAQLPLPDIYPLKATISMPQSNIYQLEDHYPLTTGTAYQHAHTVLLHCAAEQVANLHESPVTETQLEARALLKAFAVAAASARARFGAAVGVLPQPIVVQAVQTDGRRFQFGTLQLNTLDVAETEEATAAAAGPRNVWHSVPTMRLFDLCEYRAGQPVLSEYNRQVLRHLYAFYRNN